MPVRLLLVSPVLLFLAACAALAPPGIEGSPRAARAQLAAAAAAGPVPVVLHALPEGLAPETVLEAAREGIAGLQPRFEPVDGPRPAALVLAFADADPVALCESRPGPTERAEAAAGTLTAVWCGTEGPVASVTQRLDPARPEAVERAVWRAVRWLFPDDYADRYGFDLFGLRIGIGATFGF